MLCEKCKKNEATNFYHENVNGRIRTMRLCGDCAKALEETGELTEAYGNDPGAKDRIADELGDLLFSV